jgi:hypothetical protein
MANTILIKRSGTANAVPTSGQLANGEIAINYADGNLFYKDTGGTVTLLVSNKFVSVTGNITTTSNISGNYFIGNGSQLTGVVAVSSYGNANVVANLAALGSNPISTTGNITGGNLNAAGLSLSSNVVSDLNVTANIAGANVTAPGLISAAGNITGANINGNGSGLSSITGANVTGTVANATYAVTAGTAYSVSGANVVGNVSNAVHAYFADVANSISGSNVTGQVANALVAGTVYTNAQPNITSVGILTSLSSSGNITGGNLNAAGLSLSSNVVSALVSAANITTTANISGGNIIGTLIATSFSTTGNITGGNLITAAAVSAASVSASGNVTGGNLNAAGMSLSSNVVSALNVTGAIAGANLTTSGLISATGNITGSNVNATNLSLSGNVISALNVSSTIAAGSTISAVGNITGGNLITAAAVSAASVSASGNVIGGNVNTNTIVGTATTIKSTGALNLSATGNITVNSTYINGVLDPVQNQDVATKNYVDTVAQGLDSKASVHTATTAALPAYTYNNGTSGVGATLTGTATGTLTVAGDTILLNQRVLIKDETGAFVNNTTMSAAFNGIYLCTTEGAVGVAYVLTRATDFDTAAEMYSAFTFVETGTGIADTGWVCTNNVANPITVGTTQILFTQFSSAGTYSANTSAGLALTGTVFSAKTDNVTTAFDGTGNIIVKTGAVLTTPNIGAATGTSLSVTGNITGGNLNAAGLSLSGNVVSALVSAANITTSANISGGNILGGANVNATTHTGSTVSVLGNITGGNVLNNGLISSTGNSTAANYLTGGLISATGNITGGNLRTSGSISATGNVTTGNVTTGNIQGTGALIIKPAFNSNISIQAGDNNTGDGGNVNIVGGTGDTGNPGGNVVITAGYTGAIDGTIVFKNSSGSTDLLQIIPSGAVNLTNGTGGYLRISGGVYANGNLYVNSAARIVSNTVSTSTTSGALQVGGGVGIVGNAYIGGLVSATGNITTTANISGGNILGGANVNATTHTGTTVSVSGNVTTANLIINGTAAAGFGVLTVSGNIQTTTANNTANIGNVANYFNTVHAKATTAQYADLAEWYSADADYPPGTVLSFGGNKEVTMSIGINDARVAGIVSTQPAHVMNAGLTGQNTVAVALIGRVPALVVGAVVRGDMMVTAGGGRAMSCATPTMGTVIGKALQDHPGGPGMIEIVVGRL